MDDSFTEGSERGSEVSEIIHTTMRYLARREYSRFELAQKLGVKYSDIDEIHQALDIVSQKGYQSDERYADLIVRSRIHQYYGPFKIRMELSCKGVSNHIIESVINSYEVDWIELALQSKVKHFGNIIPSDLRGLGKQVRYLKSRGFHQSHINAVLDCSTQLENS